MPEAKYLRGSRRKQMSYKEINHKPITNGTKFFSTLFVLIFLLVVVYVFIWLQWPIVSDQYLFSYILVSLVVASFFCSLMEAAFSALTDSHNRASIRALQKLKRNGQRLNKLMTSTNGMSPKNSEDLAELSKILKKEKRLHTVHRVAVGIDNELFVGSFATLSVILNTSIAVFLPLALLADIDQKLLVVDVPEEIRSGSILGFSVKVSPDFSQIDFTSIKVFVLCSTTIPILLLGKIVPKIVGRRYAEAIVSRLYYPAMIIKGLLGWITLGLTWFLPTSRARKTG